MPVQNLTNAHKEARLNFCQNMVNNININQNYLHNILFTDQATFVTSAMYNRKNTHFWASENPRAIREIKRSGRQSLHVWCGILNGRVIGPIFFEQNLNGQRYLELITEVNNNLNENIEIIWQQDGAPPHNVAPVTNYLNMMYPVWIGRSGPVYWPSNSPDLTVLDTFFWGYIKDKVSAEKDLSLDILRARIIEEVAILNNKPYIIRSAVNRLHKIYLKCIEQNGSHVEHLKL